VPIEQLVAQGGGENGDGGGQFVLSRDQHEPEGALVRARITRTYQRTAYRLRLLTLRDAAGCEQTLRVTEEHPFYREHGGWTAASNLVLGGRVLGASGFMAVNGNSAEERRGGVAVYNLQVEEAHTYFVLAGGATADPVWVHNASYPDADPGTAAQGERFTSLAQGWWDTLPQGKRYGSTIAVSEVDGVPIVSLYANVGTGQKQFSQFEIDQFVASVEDAGAVAIHTSGATHAEVALYNQYPGAPAIGISNPYGPCNGCTVYFSKRGYSNLYWPD
jgi:hypothetical protein